jgi:hypothetical protein
LERPADDGLEPIEWAADGLDGLEIDTKKLSENLILFAVLVCLVPPIVAIALSYLLPPSVTGKQPRLYSYLFLAHRNPTFAANFELSLRGSLGMLVLAIPFMSPDFSPVLDAKLYTSTAALLFVFTLYKTVGETINLAFEGILGTFLAVLNTWTMRGCFPQGVTETSENSVWWCGAIEGALYVFLILAMDLDINCKMFALNWYCYFWMDFMNPHKIGTYSAGFEIDITGPAVSGLVQSCIGVGIAVCATLLPFPLFALNKARDLSLKLADELAESYDAAINCFVNEKKERESESRFRHDVESLTAHVGSMAGYADIAWWECLGLPGRPQRVRDFLCQLHPTVVDSYNRLCGLRHLCRVAPRGSEHKQLMEAVRPHLEHLSKQTGDLMKTLTACSIDGSLDEEEKATIQAMSKNVTAATVKLTQEYTQAMVILNPPGDVDMDMEDGARADLFHEAMFCLTYCSYARITQNFEQVLVANLSSGSMTFDNIRTWFTRFQPGFADPMVRNCCLRSSSAILLCFLVGYVGYSAILPRYNAVPAATVSLLLSSGFAAQASKNLTRFEGVILGIVFGQMAYSFFGWCTPLSYVGVGVFIVLWTLPTFIMYYHTTGFSLLGCLLAAFGAVGVLRGCTNETFKTSGSYQTVVSVVVAITIKVVVDCCLARGRASDEATKALVDAWEQLRVAMMEFFSPDVGKINFKHKAIRSAFQGAASLSTDADKEPRLWWAPWKHGLFTQSCLAGDGICEGLSILETVFSKTGCDGGRKSITLSEAENNPEFRTLCEDILRQIEAMKHLSYEAFSYNRDGSFRSVYRPPQDLPTWKSMRNQISAFAHELKKQKAGTASGRSSLPLSFGRSSAPTLPIGADESDISLEYDLHCKLGVFCTTLDRFLELMEDVETSILSE